MLSLTLFHPATPAAAVALCLLAAGAGVGKAVADAAAHGSPKLVRWFPKWAGPDSWRYKYKQNDPALGPAFPGSTTVFVFLTDCWHAANAFTWLCADAGLVLAAGGSWWALGAVVARRAVFQPAYSFLRKS